MRNRGQLVHVLEAFFAEMQSVCVAYLFGSLARGEAGAESDVDIAILPCSQMCSESRLLLRIDIAGALEKRLRCAVDVVDLRAAPVHLVHAVLVNKVILKGHHSEERVAFEVAARREYFDTQRRREAYRTELFRRAFRGGEGHGQPGDRGRTIEAARRIHDRRWISGELQDALTSMAGFRNILVHDYATLDPATVFSILRKCLPDLRAFAATISGRTP